MNFFLFQKQVRPKTTTTTTNSNPRSRKKPALTGLNGNYWNVSLDFDDYLLNLMMIFFQVVQVGRQSNTTSYGQLNDDDDDDDDNTTSSSEQAEKEELRKMLSSSSSSSSDLQTLLYSNRTFITCRSPSDSFFLCQVLQDVYNDTKKFRIRWCSRTNGDDDDTDINENTRFIVDYEDTLDPQTILTGIPNVIRHPDKTVSLKKQDIIETKRLLEKSIKGETPSSEEPMDLTKDNDNLETPKKIPDDESLSVRETPISKVKKRKITSETSRKQQPPKKRARKISGEPKGIAKRTLFFSISFYFIL